jgi:small subunit ribosomal protein S19
MSRSVKKGPFVEKSLKEKIEILNSLNEKKVVKTWSRPSMILPIMVGHTIAVHDGRETARALLSSQELATPVTEVRRVGTRVPSGAAEIEAIIRDAAAAQGADADQLLRVAYCESRYNPGAYNASGASGLFQFLPSTWAANSVRAGFAGASVWDPVASANVAAYMFRMGQAGQWVCK